MTTIDWLPEEPLSVADCAERGEAADGVHRVVPIFGLMPAPSATVVAMFADRDDGAAWLGFHPDNHAWIEVESGEPTEQLFVLASLTDAIWEFMESQYPDRPVCLLKQSFARC